MKHKPPLLCHPGRPYPPGSTPMTIANHQGVNYALMSRHAMAKNAACAPTEAATSGTFSSPTAASASTTAGGLMAKTTAAVALTRANCCLTPTPKPSTACHNTATPTNSRSITTATRAITPPLPPKASSLARATLTGKMTHRRAPRGKTPSSTRHTSKASADKTPPFRATSPAPLPAWRTRRASNT